VSRPRLLLVPFVTALEWERISPLLEQWAEIATFDPPGVGGEPLPPELDRHDTGWDGVENPLGVWRRATAARGLAEVESRGWERYFVVTDSYGITPATLIAAEHRERVLGLAFGHAALSHGREGERAPVSKEVWEAMGSLMKTDVKNFIAYGIAQLTQGAVSDEQAARWMERFNDREVVARIWLLLGDDAEPVGDRLHELGLPLLLAQHMGCIANLPEGFEDIVAEFPDAATAKCPEACAASPVFAEAVREFCASVADPA
jgi:hypothetical protein